TVQEALGAAKNFDPVLVGKKVLESLRKFTPLLLRYAVKWIPLPGLNKIPDILKAAWDWLKRTLCRLKELLFGWFKRNPKKPKEPPPPGCPVPTKKPGPMKAPVAKPSRCVSGSPATKSRPGCFVAGTLVHRPGCL